MSNETKSKGTKATTPGERITAELNVAQAQCAEQIRKKTVQFAHMSDGQWIAFLKTEDAGDVVAGIHQSAIMLCLMRELDREAVRRAAFEAEAERWMNDAGKVLAAIAAIPSIAEVLAADSIEVH